MPLIILLFALFASIFTLQKQTLQYADPLFIIGTRMLFAGIVLISYCIIIQRKKIKIHKKRHYLYFLALSFFGIYLTNVCEILGTTGMDSSKVCLIYSFTPFVTVLFTYVLYKEQLKCKQYLGLSLGFLGLLPINNIKTNIELQSTLLYTFSKYEIIVFAAVVFSVIGWMLLKELIKYNYPITVVNGYSMSVGGLLILTHSYFIGENWTPSNIDDFTKFLEYNLITCIISNFCCYNLFGYLLKRYSVTLLTFAGLLTPFFSIFFGFIFLHEIITIQFFIALLLFYIGLLVYYYEEKKQNTKNNSTFTY